MITFPGYRIIKKIYESDHTLVFRARQNRDNRYTILKLLKEECAATEEIIQYNQEYKITRSLESLSGVINVYGLERYQSTLVMMLEDLGAESLNILIKGKEFSLEEFLKIALCLTDILGEIHAADVIHKDINPSNIVFNPTSGEIKIIDFGVSTTLPRENAGTSNPKVPEGTLAYMSPEQTGRMNRQVDYRTDFYSLGATLYELLLRRPPFDCTDSMELVHCHIAKKPVPPHKLNMGIPMAVSNIVMKLLEKNPEDRYQSARGIHADLKHCMTALCSKGTIPDLRLGGKDISERFQISQKLYGRNAEIETLRQTLRRVAGGRSELLLISGHSGVGKTALIQEMRRPITQEFGCFFSGKFSQFQENIPYSAVIRSFQELVRHLLTEGEADLSHWREELLEALGPNGQVIIDIIPELELIIGPQPPVTELTPTERKNRFDLVFLNFIGVFAKPERPMILFLDDLQWADMASLKLIELFVTARDSKNLLFLGAYRDNEVTAACPMMMLLDETRRQGSIVNEIRLSPLDSSSVTQLISDSLTCTRKSALPLAELVMAKTGGNPFFVRQFLKSLSEKGLLTFDTSHLRWEWSMERICALNITDNVVDLILGRIRGLSDNLQEMLNLAACIGNRFELKTVATVCKKPERDTAILMQEAVSKGLIVPLEAGYKSLQLLEQGLTVEYLFSHDRIRHAVYSSIPDHEEQRLHWTIGRLLLQKTPQGAEAQDTFNIVNHLNLGRGLIGTRAERDELAGLNLIAGKKAKSAVAFESASKYLGMGVELLEWENGTQEGSCWHTQYDLTLALHVEAAEAACLCSEFVKMEELIQAVIEHAQTPMDKVKAYEIRIRSCIAQNKPLEGVRAGLTALRLLGLNFPEKPKKLHILFALLRTKLALAGKNKDDLLDLPQMTDPIKLATIRILMNLGTAAYFSVPDLFPLIVLKGVHLSVKYGNSPESVVAYASYGIILCAVLGDIDAGHRFGQLALSLLSRIDAKGIRPRALVMVVNFVNHWKNPLRKGSDLCLEAFQFGMETGDFEWAAYAAQNHCFISYIVGKGLMAVERDFATYSQAIEQLKQEIPLLCNEMNHQAVLNLMGRSENPCRLIGESYDEQKMLPQHFKANDGNSIFALCLNKLMLCYLFQEHDQAVEAADKAEEHTDAVVGQPEVPLFHFYDSLARLAVFSKAPKLEQKQILKKVSSNQKRMKKWAHHAPVNSLHKLRLVEAEQCRVLGHLNRAETLYDQAIELAHKHGFLNEEGVANELAANFYLKRDEIETAGEYFKAARSSYVRWGAFAKVRDLDGRHPNLLGKLRPQANIETTTMGNAVNGSGKELDIISVMKASQAISGEIVFDRLLDKLMTIVMENSGAQRGILILNTNGKLLLEAESVAGENKVRPLHSIPVDESKDISPAVVNYAARTHKCVALDNAAQEHPFSNDPYIRAKGLISVLCTPLLHKSKLMGMLYMENNLVTGAFTALHSSMLHPFCSQIAVSLENARLYAGMETQTDKIRIANLRLKREINQRRKAEMELSRYRDHLEELVERRTEELGESRRALVGLERDMKKRQNFRNMVGKSESMQEIYSLIEDLTDVPTTVLITGESGTGKELVAEALHYVGIRRDKPFVKVNCSALSETILESELFGHIRGAFTGADKNRIGRFQKAEDGTILLDEIGDISLEFQKRLLRVLEEREFEQVGDSTPIKTGARVIAATNQDLREKVRRGEFREDLYYRLKVVDVNLLPLRKRRDDIPLLVCHFLDQYNKELNKKICDVSSDLLKLFMEYRWPGNIRELKHCMEHVCILCKKSTITFDDLPSDLKQTDGSFSHSPAKADEKSTIMLVLEETRWNKTRAADLLGVSRRTLYRKMEKHNITEKETETALYS